MPVYVALLRGINVGGQKSIKMEDLRSSFETIGYKNVRSYVQSGNIVFSSGSSTNENQSRKIGKKILKDYGFSVNMMVRDSAEMSKIVRDSPFLKEPGVDPSKLHVTFLSKSPTKSSLQRVELLNRPPDQFRIAGREIYLHCPNGYARTRLSNSAIERALSVQATTRNWNTINTLAKMSAEQTSNKEG